MMEQIVRQYYDQSYNKQRTTDDYTKLTPPGGSLCQCKGNYNVPRGD